MTQHRTGRQSAHEEKERPDCKDASTTVKIPKELLGFVIGKYRQNLKVIERDTQTKIYVINFQEGDFLVKGFDENKVHRAKLKLKNLGWLCLNKRRKAAMKKMVFVDGSGLSEECEFSLETVMADAELHPAEILDGNYYKLILSDPLMTEESATFQDDNLLEGICSAMLGVLGNMKEEEEQQIDLWCHFGHIWIKNVFEEDENEIYDLEQVRKKFKVHEKASNSKANWQWSFQEGIEDLQFGHLETRLSTVSQYKIPPNIRYDFWFLTPSCRQIGMKVFHKADGDQQGGSMAFYDNSPIAMSNVLTHVNTDGSVNFYLCGKAVTWLRLDIILPALHFDCRLILRSTSSVVSRSPEEEEEDRILVDYLSNNLVWKDGKLELSQSSPRPEGFDLTYVRRCSRRSYPYSCSGEDFTVMISEEASEELEGLEPVGFSRCDTDMHLHCNAWDEKLSQGDWEPQEIVSKLPAFFGFVRGIQQNIFVQEQENKES